MPRLQGCPTVPRFLAFKRAVEKYRKLAIMEVPRDTLTQLLNHSRQLYSLPAVALEVLDLTNQPQVDTARLKDCIERDPALTIKVLRVVNSSLFGLSRRVSDLNQAIALLGTKPLKMLVLGFGLPEPLFAGLARDVLNHYWKHTLTRAVAARELSERVWKMPGDEVFVAGLLTDLGRLMLIQGLGRPYVEMLRKADWPREEVRALERRLIGFDHVQLTVGLLEQWGLPETLVDAVQSPDTRVEGISPDSRRRSSGDCATGKILGLAEKFAELLADERAGVLPELLAAAAEEGITEPQITALTASLDETVSQLAAVLSLDLPPGLAYSEVLARAYLQLSLVASDAAGELARGGQVASKLRDFADREEARRLSAAASCFRPDPSPKSSGKHLHLGQGRQDGHAAEPAPAVVSRPATSAASPGQRTRQTVASRAKTITTPAIQPTLRARILSAAALCRQMRQELSLLMIEIDDFQNLVSTRGLSSAEQLRHELHESCRLAEWEQGGPVELSEARFAIVLAGCDRPAAADVGHLLLREAREKVSGGVKLTLSIGASTVVVPAKNFDALDMVRSAERCLRAAQLSGGNCFKSIEAY
jgi:HD-like signal output (HDOD) protein/GGDEF domain-containing protein